MKTTRTNNTISRRFCSILELLFCETGNPLEEATMAIKWKEEKLSLLRLLVFVSY